MKMFPIATLLIVVTGVSTQAEYVSPVPLFPLPGEVFQGSGLPLLSYGAIPVMNVTIHAGGLIPGPNQPDLNGPPSIDSFFDVFVEIDLGAFGIGTASGAMRVGGLTSDPLLPGSRTFDTEMLQLDLTGSVSGLGAFLLRESPTRPSLGQTTITQLGDGPYHIHSFFDVFTEISLDGGQNWQPQQQQDSGAHLQNIDTEVPEASTIGAIGLLGVACGWRLLGRRR